MFKKILICFIASIICTGCVGSKTAKVEEGVGNKQLAWKQFKENRPEREYYEISDEGATITFKSAANVYCLTSDLLDKTVARTENCSVALKLENVRKEYGDETYEKALSELTVEERAEYDKYLDNEINSLATVGNLLTNAINLQIGLLKVDYIKLAVNPFEYKKIYSGTSNATNQIEYSVRALSWMNDYRASLSRARNYKGR